jgi:type I restriction enzyme S subunit
MRNWKTKKLLDVCKEITSGGAAPQGEAHFTNGTYSFVRVADMGELDGAKNIKDTRDHLNDTGILKLRLFPKGTVLFTKSGASLLLNQRAVLSKPMYVVSHIGCLIPNEEITSDWLYYWMKRVDFAKYAHATTLPSLKLSVLKELELPVPSIEEQERIVAKIEEHFSELDNGVETLKKTK